MPTAEIVLVADAVAAELNAEGANFSQEFTAVRGYQTDTELQDLGPLHVDVVPVTPDPVVEARWSVGCRNQIDVAIRKRFEGDAIDADTGRVTNTAIDAMMLLEQELFLYLVNKNLATYQSAGYLEAVIRAAWVPEHIDRFHQFTGIVRVTYATSLSLAE